MANIKAKVKNIKKIEKQTIRNRAIKSKVKTAVKKVKKLITSGQVEAKKLKELVAKAHSEINRAVSKGVFHKKNGARKQARLDAFVAKNNK